MRIFLHYTNLPKEMLGAVVTLGNFDGVHRGHQSVIAEAGSIARRLGVPSAVLTFEPHPVRVFRPTLPPFRLTPFRVKARHLEAYGVDALFVLHFDLEFSKKSAEDFVTEVLVDGLGARHVVVGYDFAFGHRRRGNAEFLKRMASAQGFGFTRVEPVLDPAGEIYSSSKVREYLAAGQPSQAATLLGRSWEIEGRVERGDRRGHKLGFATANIRLVEFMHPATGVYAVRAGIDRGGDTIWRHGVANLGHRPTFGGDDLLLEVHLFDFAGELYGRHLRVALVEYLRSEKKFDGLESLRTQIAEDSQRARRILAERDAVEAAVSRSAGQQA
ncbi:MAG: bifunctional riboflavin kinase/FAD synthetase [Proteobacteria bacterium]|nr:bifunctional riboflavin kinase/FAD synthetase [Pseudomonadota bacterium]